MLQVVEHIIAVCNIAANEATTVVVADAGTVAAGRRCGEVQMLLLLVVLRLELLVLLLLLIGLLMEMLMIAMMLIAIVRLLLLNGEHTAVQTVVWVRVEMLLLVLLVKLFGSHQHLQIGLLQFVHAQVAVVREHVGAIDASFVQKPIGTLFRCVRTVDHTVDQFAFEREFAAIARTDEATAKVLLLRLLLLVVLLAELLDLLVLLLLLMMAMHVESAVTVVEQLLLAVLIVVQSVEQTVAYGGMLGRGWRWNVIVLEVHHVVVQVVTVVIINIIIIIVVGHVMELMHETAVATGTGAVVIVGGGGGGGGGNGGHRGGGRIVAAH